MDRNDKIIESLETIRHNYYRIMNEEFKQAWNEAGIGPDDCHIREITQPEGKFLFADDRVITGVIIEGEFNDSSSSMVYTISRVRGRKALEFLESKREMF